MILWRPCVLSRDTGEGRGEQPSAVHHLDQESRWGCNVFRKLWWVILWRRTKWIHIRSVGDQLGCCNNFCYNVNIPMFDIIAILVQITFFHLQLTFQHYLNCKAKGVIIKLTLIYPFIYKLMLINKLKHKILTSPRPSPNPSPSPIKIQKRKKGIGRCFGLSLKSYWGLIRNNILLSQ